MDRTQVFRHGACPSGLQAGRLRLAMRCYRTERFYSESNDVSCQLHSERYTR